MSIGPVNRVPIPVRIHYLVGNHDWFFHLSGPAHDAIRKMIVEAIGLENSPTIPFPHEPFESQVLDPICPAANCQLLISLLRAEQGNAEERRFTKSY